MNESSILNEDIKSGNKPDNSNERNVQKKIFFTHDLMQPLIIITRTTLKISNSASISNSTVLVNILSKFFFFV